MHRYFKNTSRLCVLQAHDGIVLAASFPGHTITINMHKLDGANMQNMTNMQSLQDVNTQKIIHMQSLHDVNMQKATALHNIREY